MLFELSKDKSLLYVLSKVELDEETQALVNAKAGASEIKKSLERNINPNNIVHYRKYILKAEEEEEEEASVDNISGFEDSELDDTRDEVDISVDDEARMDAMSREEELTQQKGEKEAYKFLVKLRTQVDALEKIADTAQVRKVDNKIDVRGAGKAYQLIGTNPTKSGKVLDTLALIVKDPKYIQKTYGKYLDNRGILQGKDIKIKDDGSREVKDNKNKDLNVREIISRIDRLLKLQFTVEGSEEKVDFYTVLRRLHVKSHGREPRNLVNKPKVRRERINMLLVTQGKNALIETQYNKSIKTLQGLQRKLDNVSAKKRVFEDAIEELNETLQNADKVIENKLNRLINSLNTILSSGRVEPDKLREKTKEIRELKENKERYLEEAKREIQEDIEIETKKLEKVIFDIEAAERVRPITKDFKKLVALFQDKDPIAVIKDLIVEGTSILVYLDLKARIMQRVANNAEGDVEEGLQAYLQDNPDVTLRIESDGLQIDGLPTVDAEALRRIDEISETFAEKQEELENIVNQLNNLIEGGNRE